MSSTEHMRLQSIKMALIEDLKPKYVMTDLLKDNIVTKEEKVKILSMGSSEQQAKILYDILLDKNSEVLDKFFGVLSKEDEKGAYYPWLAEKCIQSNLNNLKDEKAKKAKVQEVLVNGGVPFQTNCLLPREKKLEYIRKKLIFATLRNGKRHWVVLHGMAGTGKSVLAAEAVRDSNIIENYFPEGVFWISLGNLQDDNAVGLKQRKLFRFLNADEKYIHSAENVDDLTHALKKIVKSRKILLILDDVWEHKKPNVVALFDIGCPILVTTNFRRAFEKYSEFCSFIECSNDFTIDESKKLLSLYVECESHMLPPFVDAICAMCKKSPFIISHIGRWMAPYGNNISRWLDLQQKITKEKGTHSLLRSRHVSGDEIDEIKRIIYSTLDLKQIEKYKDQFFDFVIFPDDVWVCQKVLEVVWSESSFDTSIIIDSLANSSLVQYEKDSLNVYTYGIHDLYLEILKKLCCDTTERKLRLVNNYLRLCKTSNGNYDFSLLPKDNYIHYYIGHHMVEVQNMKILDNLTLDHLYFDLKFIETRLILDPRDLLWDYNTYKPYFKDEQLEVFECFVKKVAFKKNIQHCDIIQWGLFEPKDSIIYNKALTLALESRNKDYFKWCNQEENLSHMLNLNARLTPYENLRHAAISSDGKLIACAGTESIVTIFSSETGEELLVLTGHSSTINYCIFNSSQSIIASASDDKSVRIFEINIPENVIDVKPSKKRPSVTNLNSISPTTPDMSNMIYMEHLCEVLCCNFSPDGELLVSSDSEGYANVWHFKTGDKKYSVYHSCSNTYSSFPNQINYCDFNPDGKLFATAMYDSLILWNVEDGTIVKTFLHDDMHISGFCFSKDHIISVSNCNIHKYTVESGISTVMHLPENLVITSCSLSPDGNFIACGTSQCTVLVHNINTEKRINLFKGHRSSVCSIMYAKNNQKLLSVSEDGYIVHNISEVKEVSLIGFEGNLSVQQHLNDLIIACSDSQNSIEIRKGISGKLYCKSDQDDCDITACSLSNNCTEVIYGTKSGSVKVFNISDKSLNATLPNHDKQINYIIHSKNDLFFTCSEDKTIKVWKGKEKIPVKLKGHTQSVVMCVPFKKSNKLLSCSKDGTLIVWDTETYDKLVFTEGHGNQDIRFCDISWDERYMASASSDQTVKVWYCENGQLYRTFDCNEEVRCCRFSPNFQVIISGCDSGNVVRWQLGQKTTAQALYKHQSCVFNIYFSRDGSKYLTIADDIKIGKTGEAHSQTLQLPSSYMGVARPNIWVNDGFEIFIIILDSVLYVLEKIVISNGNSCH